MKRIFQVAVLVLIVAFCFGQFALAADPHHWTVKAIPSGSVRANGAHSNAADANNLYAEYAAFVLSPVTAYVNPFNTDGSELWPCFGGGTAANTDCSSIGDPAQPYVGVSLGAPSWTWPLSLCDASSTADAGNYCGQTNTWYEDDSLDSTDDLTYLIYATQGAATNFIADSGTVDFGPNVYGVLNPGYSVIIYGDQNFGTYGVAAGPNNGACSGPYNYPLTAPANPGAVYVIPAGKTCHNPASGLVNFAAVTEIGTPKYKKSTSATVCAPAGGPPCWTVSFTKKKAITQKWSIWLD
jgi:hypothetical protein